MNRPWLFVQAALFLGLVHLNPTYAATQTSSTAASLATAGTGRASVEAGDVHELNPAMLVHLRGRDLHSAASGDSLSVGISDNARDSIIPAALAWKRARTEKAGLETRREDLRLTLADVVKGNLSMGVTGRQTSYIRGGVDWREVNADVGFAWIATPKVGLGLVVSNSFPGREDMPDDLIARPQTSFGVNYLWSESVRFRGDLISGAGNHFGKSVLAGGYEAALNRFFVARLGAATDAGLNREIASAGFGFDLPRFRINYGVQGVVRGEGETWHSVDLGIPF